MSIQFLNITDNTTISLNTRSEVCVDICQSFVDFIRAVGFSDVTIVSALISLDIMIEDIDEL